MQRRTVGECSAPVCAASDEFRRECTQRHARLAARRRSEKTHDDAGAADRRATRSKLGKRGRTAGQHVDQRIGEKASIAEPRVAAAGE